METPRQIEIRPGIHLEKDGRYPGEIDSSMHTNTLGINSVAFQGLRLISSPAMREPILQRRSMWDRLFSLHPFRVFKVVGYRPMNTAIRVGNDLFAAPEMVNKILEIEGAYTPFKLGSRRM